MDFVYIELGLNAVLLELKLDAKLSWRMGKGDSER